MPGELWNDEQEHPVRHLRVIDMTVMLPAPYLTRLLAQYGADVVKIENLPSGDPLRQPPYHKVFEVLNQGKRSVALNLRSKEGVSVVRQLASEADIFVENLREGVMDGFGLGYAELSEENPDLIYCSLRGFRGKNAVHSGHDLNFIAVSGCGEWFLENGNPNYSTLYGDMIGGTFVPLIQLLFHVANPDRRGMQLVSYIDENFRALYLPRVYELFRAGPHQTLAFQQMNGSRPHSRFYRCRDGLWISLNAIQKKHWDLFCTVVDREAWKERMDDPTLVSEVEKLFADAPATYWEALSANRELCLFRVIPWDEHLISTTAAPQLSTDPLSWCGFAPNLSLCPAPNLGTDTFSVMHSLGIDHKQIAEWMQAGHIYQPDGGKPSEAAKPPTDGQ
ncbi:MAG: CoA transferase [Deltaproteobacteria bacterium]|nr:CoA transferase [Deltaproteobacteria bacterium]